MGSFGELQAITPCLHQTGLDPQLLDRDRKSVV